MQFQLKLHLLDILLHALHFEFVALKFALDAAFGAALVLQVLRELHKHLVLFQLDRVTLSTKLCCFAQQFLLLSLMSVKITAKLPD